MSIRGIGDAYAFQRLLWLLVGTVIVPTVLLALYGVWAIRNHRVAVQDRLRADQLVHLQEVARSTFDQIGRLDREVRTQCIEDAACEIAGVRQVWRWDRESDLPGDLASIGVAALGTPQTTWYAPADATDPIGLFRVADTNVAWRLDMPRLATFAHRIGTTRSADISLEQARAGPATRLEELMPGTEFAVFLPLDRPLAQWRLRATLTEASLEAGFFRGSAWLYTGGLIALVATVVVGTVVTLSSANREFKLSRLQTDFVSSVSHELRTPLTSIRMFVETLQSGRLKDEDRVQEALDLLAQETDRLSRMIERVLEWARMEAGRRAYEQEPVRPHELVSEALQALKTQDLFGEDAEAIHVDVPVDLPRVQVDRDAIVLALLNLLQNAIKYTPPPRRIAVEARQRRGQLGLVVSDNGPGIPRADRRRIFEKFYQVDSRLSSPHQGSGLGLSIVRAVVRGHGGRVELETELGRGSRFTIWLATS